MADRSRTVEPVNDVRVIGRLSADPVSRALPSGDQITSLRLAVPRGDGRTDALDVTLWTAALRRSAASWSTGDVVEVEGHVRRRFWRSPGGPASRWEIEATRVRRHRGYSLAG